MFYLLACLQGGILFLFMNFLFMVYIYTYFCTLSKVCRIIIVKIRYHLNKHLNHIPLQILGTLNISCILFLKVVRTKKIGRYGFKHSLTLCYHAHISLITLYSQTFYIIKMLYIARYKNLVSSQTYTRNHRISWFYC